MIDTEQVKKREVSLKGVKSNFGKKFPQFASPVQSLPDKMNFDEFVGAVGVLLDQLDRERAKKLADRINNEEVV